MKKYDVAAYIWPSYHYEPRMEHFWPEKDGEWYTVRRGTPRFEGHHMPQIPLLGYQDEADPKVMRQHVELALEHGVNLFIMDWYWYENQPCFERQLNEGLIPALEGTDAKFCLMWANHDVSNLWNMHEDTFWDGTDEIQLTAGVSREELEPMFDRIIDKYFSLDSYYCIEEKPLFSIFAYPTLIDGLGGVDQTADAFTWMRGRCKEKGLDGVHLQAIARVRAGVEGTAKMEAEEQIEIARKLRFDSATSYQYCMDAELESYPEWAEKASTRWPQYESIYKTYFSHVSVGWDNTPRNPSFKTDHFVENSNPDTFETALRRAKKWADEHPEQPPLITINSWNEWTEGSYLLPDKRWGYGYLEAVKNVFVEK